MFPCFRVSFSGFPDDTVNQQQQSLENLDWGFFGPAAVRGFGLGIFTAGGGPGGGGPGIWIGDFPGRRRSGVGVWTGDFPRYTVTLIGISFARSNAYWDFPLSAVTHIRNFHEFSIVRSNA